MAAKRPAAVATSASEMPGPMTERLVAPVVLIFWNASRIPQTVPKRPMKGEVLPTEADKARLPKILEEAVIPSWVKRCGERCGDIYNQVIAPISGVKYVKR